MNDEAIRHFIEELDEWISELEDKWSRFLASHEGDLREQDECVSFNQLLQSVILQIDDLKANPETITSQTARELQSQASELFGRWNKLIHTQPLKESSNNNKNEARSVPIGGHELPPLPYDYDSLEPHISGRIMRLHHQDHHQSYVDGLNKAEKEMQKARKKNDFDLIKHWEREAAFNGAGHYLHTIFWNVMSPDGGGEPGGELLDEFNQSFGSFDAFKNHFTEAANHVEGVGWAILVWAPRSHRLEILQAEKHQNLSQWDVIPLLVLDVWEHAYYLQYENKRGDYVDNWWNVVNWDEVEKRYLAAKDVKWKAY
ncbi:superoxide dismutase [Alkalibacillus aidingensis]|uniref:superoxide dismutase n=1 Tax=Alkalibacillus aidingensis TaxID=2747607 RepID=UPI0016609FA3|nr:superoxide dismutase [Alkalibacillus aidingensis]